MARLVQETGPVLSDVSAIDAALAPLGVRLQYWPVAQDVAHLLAEDQLDADAKEQVLKAHDSYFESLQNEAGYQSRDLIVLHPEIPGLADLLQKFDRCHTHSDDEVRYIVSGEGVFGFVFPNGEQAELTIEPGEYINVPANTEHWFVLTGTKRIKAIRYFSSTDGWVANYTNTAIRIPAGEAS
ncbi:MAG: acireductone dioxygenase [Myxococcales bacterium]|nr:acireductone dioxygenase [Myxococcales bacterium]|tara:strand:- start:399 stop:947 length:549 start_codon:yes stop_codon:yes gene_type:complete